MFWNFKIKNPRFQLATLEKIIGHWINKCKLFKRPLLRKNYKEVLSKNKYGTYDLLKKAFKPRLEDEKKKTRILNKMTNQHQLKMLEDMRAENKQALVI